MEKDCCKNKGFLDLINFFYGLHFQIADARSMRIVEIVVIVISINEWRRFVCGGRRAKVDERLNGETKALRFLMARE